MKRLLSFLLPLVLVSAAAAAEPRDGVTVGTVAGTPGSRVEIPVFIRDAAYTPLSRDEHSDRKIQAFTFQVLWEPASAVTAASVTRAGLVADRTPLAEFSRTFENSLFYSATFGATGYDALPFTLDAPEPGDPVAHILLDLAPRLQPGTAVRLALSRTTTLLSNQGGTVSETAEGDTLDLVDGLVLVPAPVRLSAASGKASERGARTASVTVTRTGRRSAPLTVPYRTRGTARPGRDYLRLPGWVTIPAGSASAAIVVVPVDDSLREPRETVIIELLPDPFLTPVSPSRATVTILDNDR